MKVRFASFAVIALFAGCAKPEPVAECEQLAELCHDAGEAGNSEAEECHHFGHDPEKTAEDCTAKMDECEAACTGSDTDA